MSIKQVAQELVRYVNNGGTITENFHEYIKGASRLSLRELTDVMIEAKKLDQNLWIKSEENKTKINNSNISNDSKY